MPNVSSGTTIDFSRFVSGETDSHSLTLQVEGMHCASCAWRIESTLNALPEVKARVNFSTERLKVDWKGDKEKANELAHAVASLGFRVAPFNAAEKNAHGKEEEKFLLRCLAVSGFASGNLMLFSLALWFSHGEAMGEATRALMHWVMALISLPTIIYAGRPFFYSAWGALKNRHTNMDVPISLAVMLAALMSLHETLRHGPYVYFDASVMLLFFLLIGRYLDKKARGRAREAAEGLLAMLEGTATILVDGKPQSIIIRDIKPGMTLLVSAGEKIAADGNVTKGVSEVDTSLVTGETLPRAVTAGEKLYAGMINVAAPIELRVSAASDKSLLADIVSLLEKAEQGQAQYVRLADRVAGWYTPVVHILAAATFIGWLAFGHVWQEALLAATAVLIITCPCALGLAVPVVQVLASGKLFKRGMLLKSGNALERLASVDSVVFDKTGTLTRGTPQLTNAPAIDEKTLQLAASLAAQSKHPLAQAVASAWTGELIPFTVNEIPAHGLETTHNGKTIRLGKRSWCGDAAAPTDEQMELWLNTGGTATRFTFADTLRSDAAETIRALHSAGCETMLLSGDRVPVAASVAAAAGISEFRGEVTPLDKTRIIEEKIAAGRKVLMIGDGLNDAPALAAATVSMSPSSAVDITQNAADLVFRGEKLAPVLYAITIAKCSHRLVKENFILAMLYNIVAVPLAVAGLATPLISSIAMSSSSLIVIGNSFRLEYLSEQNSV
jgi:Cu2+-exporting ATPase